MKIRRRIEITTYRRRAIVVLNDEFVGGNLEPLAVPVITPSTVAAESQPDEAAETNQPQVGTPQANSFAISRFNHGLPEPKAGGK